MHSCGQGNHPCGTEPIVTPYEEVSPIHQPCTGFSCNEPGSYPIHFGDLNVGRPVLSIEPCDGSSCGSYPDGMVQTFVDSDPSSIERVSWGIYPCPRAGCSTVGSDNVPEPRSFDRESHVTGQLDPIRSSVADLTPRQSVSNPCVYGCTSPQPIVYKEEADTKTKKTDDKESSNSRHEVKAGHLRSEVIWIKGRKYAADSGRVSDGASVAIGRPRSTQYHQIPKARNRRKMKRKQNRKRQKENRKRQSKTSNTNKQNGGRPNKISGVHSEPSPSYAGRETTSISPIPTSVKSRFEDKVKAFLEDFNRLSRRKWNRKPTSRLKGKGKLCRDELCTSYMRSFEEAGVDASGLCPPGYNYRTDEGIVYCEAMSVGPVTFSATPTVRLTTSHHLTSTHHPKTTQPTAIHRSTPHRPTLVAYRPNSDVAHQPRPDIAHNPTHADITPNLFGGEDTTGRGDPSTQCPKGMLFRGTECVRDPGINPCPTGFTPLDNNGQTECVKIDVQTTGICPPNQIDVDAPGGAICQYEADVGRTLSHICPPGQITTRSGLGYVCVGTGDVRPTCGRGTTLREVDGKFTCVEVAPLCKEGETKEETTTGWKCVSGTTTAPCPTGLESVETSVGRICQYVAIHRPVVPTCSGGQALVRTSRGYKCRDKTSPSTQSPPDVCPPGFMTLDTRTGTRCIKETNPSDSNIVCPEGFQLVQRRHGDECQPIQTRDGTVELVCPLGQTSVVTDHGVMCQYRTASTLSNQDNGLNNPLTIYSKCPLGQILTQKNRGFFCEVTDVNVTEWVCSPGESIVQLTDELGCVGDEQTNITCRDGFVIAGFSDKFTCIPSDSVRETPPHSAHHSVVSHEPAALPCGEGEVLVTGDDGHKCVVVAIGDSLCGEGYIVQMLDSGLRVCTSTTLELHCPEGYRLEKAGPSPECVPLLGEYQHVTTECRSGGTKPLQTDRSYTIQ